VARALRRDARGQERLLEREARALGADTALQRAMQWVRRKPTWSAAEGVAVALVAISWLALVASARADELAIANETDRSRSTRYPQPP